MLTARAMPATWCVMCLVSSVVLSSGPLSAQVIAPQVIPRGARIRVSLKGSQGNSVVGIADTLKDDWLRWWPTGRFADSLPLSALNTLEVSRGRHANVLKGAVIGGVALGGLTFMFFDALGSSFADTDFREDVLYPALGGAAIGVGLGGLIGMISHSERWQRVPIGPVRVAVETGSRPR